MEKLAYEPSFLATLIRLMSYLLPHLHLLNDGASIINRFSTMLTTMIELSEFHPSILLEGLAFFESMYNNIISMNKRQGMQNLFQTVIPYMKQIMAPQKLGQTLWKPEDSLITCNNSLSCQIGTLYFLEKFVLNSDDIIAMDVQKEEFKCSLFALLEYVCGSRQYPRSRFPRALACSLAGGRAPIDAQLLELKLCEAILNLLNLDTKTDNIEMKKLSRWLLFSMELISGEFGSKADINASGETMKHALNDARTVTIFSGHTSRWQVKHFVVKVACATLTSIATAIRSVQDININLATLRNQPKNLGGYDENLLFLLHINTFLSIACSLCTMTIDQAEIYSVQNVGLQLLSLLIEYFGTTRDPDDPSPDAKELVVQNFVSQILPAVKHALAACDTENEEDTVTSEGARDLFINGCGSLCLFVKSNLITEQTTLKRILKQLLPSPGEIIVCHYPTSVNCRQLHLKPKTFVDNRMSVLLPRIGKVSCLAKLCTDGAIGLIPREVSVAINDQLSGFEEELAIISAALAIDSFKLQLLAKDNQSTIKMKSGLTFQNIQDISLKVQSEMTENWVYFSGFALILVIDILQKEDEETEKFEMLLGWLERLVIVIVHGFRISFDILNHVTSPTSIQKAEQTCAICLMALDKIVSSRKECISSIVKKEDLYSILNNVLDYLLESWMEGSNLDEENDDTKTSMLVNYLPRYDNPITKALLMMACEFVEHITQSNEYDGDMLRSILRPSIFMQEDEATIKDAKDDNMKIQIVSSYVRSWAHIISNDKMKLVDDEIIRSLFDVCIKWLRATEIKCLNDALSSLINCCLEKNVLHQAEVLIYANDAAKTGCWDVWTLLCTSKNNNDIQIFLNSSEYFLIALGTTGNDVETLKVLSSLYHVMKEHGDWVADSMIIIGGQLLLLFKMYGAGIHNNESCLTNKNRISICSGIMKIVMLSFQFMLSEAGKVLPEDKHQFDANFAEYLSAIVETLVPVIEFNGLPNQNQALNKEGDSMLGQMCAQFCVHVLRTYPSSFKLCLVNLDTSSRSILEASIRADMSGYAAQPSAPSKKKLNIKTFVSSSSRLNS